MANFASTRSDGRSHVQVVLDYVAGGEPGRLYTYDELGAVLTAGADHAFTRRDISRVVASSYARLLKEQQRAIRNVRGQGYRLALACEHNQLALSRKRRSDVQLRQGLRTLQNVRWSELDPAARQAHEGTLLVIGALWEQQRAMVKRQTAVEQAIADLTQRVSGLEKEGTR